MRHPSDQPQKQALLDLINIAIGGILIYLTTWLVITPPYQVHIWSPPFF
jgi:hypothetical protein